METKKVDIISGSVVRFVTPRTVEEEKLVGKTGLVVAILGGNLFENGIRRLKVKIDCGGFWCDEDQVQLVTTEKPEGTAHKFKVGDTVRVKNNHPAHMSRSSDGVLWISAMNRYCGRLHRITEVHEIGYILNGPWEILFSEEWLEPASPDKPKPSPKRTIVIEITDNGAMAKYIHGKEVKKTASIKRHPDDRPDDEKAAILATEKLFGRNLRDLENAVDEDFKLHSETLGWIQGAMEALGEAENRVKRLM